LLAHGVPGLLLGSLTQCWPPGSLLALWAPCT